MPLANRFGPIQRDNTYVWFLYCFVGSTVLSSYGTSSHETEGSELRKKDASDEDTQQLQPDAQVNEPSDLSGIIGFTE